ncbi:MAG: MarR family transcriptional regulator [Rhodospirillaceae bacterium]|nr:MarR family transcriptional regulator [Rhodospirillaceae bacterium]
MVYQTMSIARRQSQARRWAEPAAPAAESGLGPLPAYVGYALRRAQSASFRHLERSAAELALTPGQFSQLSAIEASPGINQGRLAALFALDKSTLSPAIDALAKRGLVRRERDAEDGRAWALSLTAAGRQLLARMRAKVEAQERIIAAALAPGEQGRLVETLRRIEAALDAAE